MSSLVCERSADRMPAELLISPYFVIDRLEKVLGYFSVYSLGVHVGVLLRMCVSSALMVNRA